jgi:hypothetical protein
MGIWLVLATAGLVASLARAGEASPPPIQVLEDPSFRRGFILLRPQPGREVAAGTIRGVTESAPVWQLAQWSSRFPFDETTPAVATDGGGLRIQNSARAVEFGGHEGILTLAVSAGLEYGDTPRAGDAPWVHLLAQQSLAKKPQLGELVTLRFHVEARRIRSQLASESGFDARLHAAQFLIFFAVQNLEKDTAGFGDFLWFGVPIFDTRHRRCSTYAAQDFGGTGKFIYIPAAERFTAGSVHDDGWVTFEADLLPLMKEGLAVARERGFLKGAAADKSLRITSCNLGWEVPGSYDVEMQIRRLRLDAEPPATLPNPNGKPES